MSKKRAGKSSRERRQFIDRRQQQLPILPQDERRKGDRRSRGEVKDDEGSREDSTDDD